MTSDKETGRETIPDDSSDEPLAFGPWRVERSLGEGAMGRVYLAYRVGEIKQWAALKVSKYATEISMRRFQQECRILASLSHANIAHYLDGGTLPDGRCWLVIEYVDGLPLDRYCEENKLDLIARLDLMLKVCEGLAYAHHALVLHRDLKPANIMVDGSGNPKILDFGIASLLDPDTEAQQTLTHHGLQPMTPEYASPEQARGERLGSASDVYALGVILFELVCGQRPYHFKLRSPTELLRVICEARPPTLWKADAKGTFSGTNIRPTHGARLGRSFRYDLNTIVQKALSKEVAGRYRSVEALASDLHRLILGQPILARPQSRWYHLSRFVARHRLAVALAAFSTLLLFGFVAYTVIGERRARAQERMALREQEISQQVTQFMVALFKAGNPDETGHQEITVKDLLAQGARRMRTEWSGDPLTKARLLLALADSHAGLSDFPTARALYDEALALEGVTPLRPKLLLHSARFFTQQAEFESAKKHLDEGIALAKSDADLTMLVDFYYEYANYFLSRGQPADAEIWCVKALTSYEQLPNRDQNELHLANLKDLYGIILSELGRVDQAISYHREAVALTGLHKGVDHPDTLNCMNTLATALFMKGRIAEAEKLLNKVLAGRIKAYGPIHRTIFQTYMNLGNAAYSSGDFEGCLANYRKAVEVGEQVYPEAHPHMNRVRYNLGILLYTTARYHEALEQVEKSLEISRRLEKGEHRGTGDLLNQKAGILLVLGRYEEAEKAARDAYTLHRRVLDFASVGITPSMDTYGMVLLHKGAFASAQALLEQSLAIRRKHYDQGQPQLATSIHNLARIRLEMGELERAGQLFDEALAIRRGFTGALAWEQALTLSWKGAWARASGDGATARQLLLEAQSIFEETKAERNPLAQCQLLLAAVLLDAGETDEVTHYLDEAQKQAVTRLDEDHPLILAIGLQRARLLHLKGAWDQAEPLLQNLLARLKQRLGNEHALYAHCRALLGETMLHLGRPDQAQTHLKDAWRVFKDLPNRPETRALAEVMAEISGKSPGN